MFIIRKKFRFEMAHILTTAYSEACKNVHGHSYILEIFFKDNTLNEDGMIIDFKKVKDEIGNYINSWDHVLVVEEGKFDTVFMPVIEKNITVKKVKYNPTAENMARDMFYSIAKLVPNLWKVRLHETETGYAEYFQDTDCCCN